MRKCNKKTMKPLNDYMDAAVHANAVNANVCESVCVCVLARVCVCVKLSGSGN